MNQLRVIDGGRSSKAGELIDRLEIDFAAVYESLLTGLAAIEVKIAERDTTAARATLEQISFARVGLRCIADAVGELAASAVDSDGREPQLPHRQPEGSPA
jgi:hypothetical protein